jgi:hypothetical protein
LSLSQTKFVDFRNPVRPNRRRSNALRQKKCRVRRRNRQFGRLAGTPFGWDTAFRQKKCRFRQWDRYFGRLAGTQQHQMAFANRSKLISGSMHRIPAICHSEFLATHILFDIGNQVSGASISSIRISSSLVYERTGASIAFSRGRFASFQKSTSTKTSRGPSSSIISAPPRGIWRLCCTTLLGISTP